VQDFFAQKGYTVSHSGNGFTIFSHTNSDGNIKVIIWGDANAAADFIESRGLPLTSTPNTDLEIRNPDGSLHQKRFYGPDGKAYKDFDYGHPDHHPEIGNPHVHDMPDGHRDNNIPPRPLTPEEANQHQRSSTWTWPSNPFTGDRVPSWLGWFIDWISR
jgi:hypothetical protein